jgi:hypothetical protein
MGMLDCQEAINSAMAQVVSETQLEQILALAKSYVKPGCLGHDWNNAICPLILLNSKQPNP